MVCPCMMSSSGGSTRRLRKGGAYKPTRKNKQLLRDYKRGKSIGFTAKASLKAKGMIPRTSSKYRGKYVLGPKYSGTGKNKVIG